jgi:hypothetical protein
MRNARIALLTATAAVSLLIAGCSSDDEASTSSTTGAVDESTGEVTTEDTTDPDGRDQAAQGPWGETAASMRGEDGRTADFDCPPDGTAGRVWGTNTYTDDSSVCTAAVQAGLITFDEGGTVTIEIAAGRDEYFGSTHNDVESQPYGAWSGSFVFPDAEQLDVVEEIAWDRPANFYNGAEGTFTVTCMADGSQDSVWGTGPFTADSSICTAALFAGEITADEGGEVTFEFSEGLESYDAGEANDVTTRSYGSYSSSFDFVS